MIKHIFKCQRTSLKVLSETPKSHVNSSARPGAGTSGVQQGIWTGTCCRHFCGHGDSLGDLPLTSRTEIPPSTMGGRKEVCTLEGQPPSCLLSQLPFSYSLGCVWVCGRWCRGVQPQPLASCVESGRTSHILYYTHGSSPHKKDSGIILL